MEDTEKLTALKKAYADIILNTAKEAAARVISSERKALQFQQELRSTKDEALRMLVRLKQMVDSKVKEAKLLSLAQQKKIEELEAQLQEGEDIVNELREDLRSAQTELEIVRNSSKKNFANNMSVLAEKQEKMVESSENIGLPPEPQSEPSTPSEMVTSNISQRCGSEKNYGPNEHRELNGSDNPEFGTLTLRRKESDLFINRCTQRIHALEGQVIKVSKTKDETFSKPLPREHEEPLRESNNHNQSEVSENIERKRPRVFKDRHKISSSRHDLHKNGGNDQTLNYPCTKSSMNSGDVEIKFNINGSNNNQKQPENEKGAVTARYRKFISNCRSNQNGMNVEKELPPVVESVAIETSEIMDNSLVPGDVRKLVVPSDDHGAAEACRRPGHEKILKYTFMRKRKRKSLSIPDESTFLEENMLAKMVDRQNGFREPPMSGFTVQPFRVSRRLAEAARQLIALSEERTVG